MLNLNQAGVVAKCVNYMMHILIPSRSASDNIRTIIEKTESVYVQKFQRSINGTLFSGEFSKSLTSEREAVGAYFASGFIDQ